VGGNGADEVPGRDSCHLGGTTNACVGGHEQTDVTCGRNRLGSRCHRRMLMGWIQLGSFALVVEHAVAADKGLSSLGLCSTDRLGQWYYRPSRNGPCI
jgi:hypothetical protein